MPALQLLPGPRLLSRDDEMSEPEDVSERAHAFLFETVDVDLAVTLGDIFALFRASPLLNLIYQRNFSRELCAEADKGALPDDSPPSEQLEYLELSQQWRLNTANREYEDTHRWSLSGIGPVLLQDSVEHHSKAGTRITWGVSLAPLRQLLTLPVRIQAEVSVTEGDMDAKAFTEEIAKVRQSSITLGQLFEGLLWDLSFHGGPEDQLDFADEVKRRTAEIDRAIELDIDELDAGPKDVRTSEPISNETPATEYPAHQQGVEPCSDGWREVAGGASRRAALTLMFESTAAVRWGVLTYAMKDVEDDHNMARALQGRFGPGIVVRLEYRHLPARAFRKAFREAKAAHQVALHARGRAQD